MGPPPLTCTATEGGLIGFHVSRLTETGRFSPAGTVPFSVGNPTGRRLSFIIHFCLWVPVGDNRQGYKRQEQGQAMEND